MPDKTPSAADFILQAMVGIAAADGRLESREIGLIQQIYQDQTGTSVSGAEVADLAEASKRRADFLAEIAAASDMLSVDTKEEIIRACYLVLLADDRIAGEERKKLQDIAAALKVPEVHFGAILEDLAVWLAGGRR